MSLHGSRVSLHSFRVSLHYIGTGILEKSHNFSDAELIYLYGIDTHPRNSEISINFAKLLPLSYINEIKKTYEIYEISRIRNFVNTLAAS